MFRRPSTLELDLGDDTVEVLALQPRELELERAGLARAVRARVGAGTPRGACESESAPTSR